MKKNDLRTIATKITSLLLAIVFSTAMLPAQSEKVRTIEKTYDGKTALWVMHRNGDLVIKKSDNSQTKVVLTLKANGKDDKETQEFLDKFDLSVTEAADNKLDVQTNSCIKNWNIIGNRSTIKLSDGSTFHGIKSFNMRLELYVPELRYATLDNTYEDIIVESGTAKILEIKQFEGTIDAQGNYDQLKLDIKYVKGTLGNFNQCDAQLYNAGLTFGNGGNMNIDAKYSKIQVGTTQSLSIVSFDGSFNAGAVSNTLKVNDKYSKFEFSGNLANAEFTLFNSKVQAGNATDIRVRDSKYSKYQFGEINSIHFDASFENDVKMAKVGSISAGSSKYSEYVADGLWKEIKFTESFEDDIVVRNVGATFSGLSIDNAKYTTVTLPVPAAVKYEVDVEMQYGKLNYPESSMDVTFYREKNESFAVKAKSKGAGADVPKIRVKGFETKLNLN